MEIIPVETTRGIINEVVYNIKDFPYDELKKFPKVKNRSKKIQKYITMYLQRLTSKQL